MSRETSIFADCLLQESYLGRPPKKIQRQTWEMWKSWFWWPRHNESAQTVAYPHHRWSTGHILWHETSRQSANETDRSVLQQHSWFGPRQRISVFKPPIECAPDIQFFKMWKDLGMQYKCVAPSQGQPLAWTLRLVTVFVSWSSGTTALVCYVEHVCFPPTVYLDLCVNFGWHQEQVTKNHLYLQQKLVQVDQFRPLRPTLPRVWPWHLFEGYWPAEIQIHVWLAPLSSQWPGHSIL